MPTSSFPEGLFVAALKDGLPSTLPEFLLKQRWFGGKARTISSVEVSDIVPFHSAGLRSYFVLAQVKYASGASRDLCHPSGTGPRLTTQQLLITENPAGESS